MASDHNPLIGRLRFKPHKYYPKQQKKAFNARNMDITIKQYLKDEMQKIQISMNIEETWQRIKTIIPDTMDSCGGSEQRVRRKPWMSTEILNLMEERSMKPKDTEKY